MRILAAWGQLDVGRSSRQLEQAVFGLTNADEDGTNTAVTATWTHDDAFKQLLRHEDDFVSARWRDQGPLAPALLDLRIRDADVAKDAGGTEEAKRPRDDARWQ